ncbi:hypothetical protein EYF80_000783 [Liparis tanakae]|uniref:SH3 domain-containing protein n=1 Tax=Liparis tanakae TaxID=230148 RepID=A0A4Z2JF78_9TELE|nr:hypothetical protein EYF80_000783 [Liparis tanakae]
MKNDFGSSSVDEGPHWPDELELFLGDVILVLPKLEEERWFGRLLGGQQGYFPASCVMELSQVGRLPGESSSKSSTREFIPEKLSLQRFSGHIRQALRRGSRGAGGGGGGGGGVVLDGGQGENEGPFPVRRHQIPVPQPVASQPQTHRYSGLLRRILSKCRKKTECQGATNGAFEGD